MKNRGSGVIAAVIITAIITTLLCFIAFRCWVYYNTMRTGNEMGIEVNNINTRNTINVPFGYDTQKKMVNLKKIIDSDFLYDYDEKDMADHIAAGMLEALDDPYTQYYNEKAFESFYTSTIGEYYGIGVYVTYDEEKHMPIVIVPLEDSPALEAGLKTADYIEYVDDLNSLDATYEEIVNAIKGAPGTYTKIGIIRKNKETKEDERLELNVERRKVEINPVKSEVLGNNIGYIKLSSFDEVSPSKFKNAYKELVDEKKVNSLIIDLRDNPGGVLDVCCEITDVIVPKGKIVYSLDKEGHEGAM